MANGKRKSKRKAVSSKTSDRNIPVIQKQDENKNLSPTLRDKAIMDTDGNGANTPSKTVSPPSSPIVKEKGKACADQISPSEAGSDAPLPPAMEGLSTPPPNSPSRAIQTTLLPAVNEETSASEAIPQTADAGATEQSVIAHPQQQPEGMEEDGIRFTPVNIRKRKKADSTPSPQPSSNIKPPQPSFPQTIGPMTTPRQNRKRQASDMSPPSPSSNNTDNETTINDTTKTDKTTTSSAPHHHKFRAVLTAEGLDTHTKNTNTSSTPATFINNSTKNKKDAATDISRHFDINKKNIRKITTISGKEGAIITFIGKDAQKVERHLGTTGVARVRVASNTYNIRRQIPLKYYMPTKESLDTAKTAITQSLHPSIRQLVVVRKAAGKTPAVLVTSPTVLQRTLQVGGSTADPVISTQITICWKCGEKADHVAKHCNRETRCGVCAGDHSTSDHQNVNAKNNPPKCPRCTREGRSPSNHTTYKCPLNIRDKKHDKISHDSTNFPSLSRPRSYAEATRGLIPWVSPAQGLLPLPNPNTPPLMLPTRPVPHEMRPRPDIKSFRPSRKNYIDKDGKPFNGPNLKERPLPQTGNRKDLSTPIAPPTTRNEAEGEMSPIAPPRPPVPSRPRPFRGRCWSCGQFGHPRRLCTHPSGPPRPHGPPPRPLPPPPIRGNHGPALYGPPHPLPPPNFQGHQGPPLPGHPHPYPQTTKYLPHFPSFWQWWHMVTTTANTNLTQTSRPNRHDR